MYRWRVTNRYSETYVTSLTDITPINLIFLKRKLRSRGRLGLRSSDGLTGWGPVSRGLARAPAVGAGRGRAALRGRGRPRDAVAGSPGRARSEICVLLMSRYSVPRGARVLLPAEGSPRERRRGHRGDGDAAEAGVHCRRPPVPGFTRRVPRPTEAGFVLSNTPTESQDSCAGRIFQSKRTFAHGLRVPAHLPGSAPGRRGPGGGRVTAPTAQSPGNARMLTPPSACPSRTACTS